MNSCAVPFRVDPAITTAATVLKKIEAVVAANLAASVSDNEVALASLKPSLQRLEEFASLLGAKSASKVVGNLQGFVTANSALSLPNVVEALGKKHLGHPGRNPSPTSQLAQATRDGCCQLRRGGLHSRRF